MHWRCRCGLLFLLFSVTACGASSSADELASELQTIRSWTATAHMVGEAWTHQAVPTAYVKQTLTTARQELQTELETIATAVPAEQRTTLLEQLQRPDRTIDQMLAAVEHDDRTAVEQQIKQLATDEQAIDSFMQRAGTQQ